MLLLLRSAGSLHSSDNSCIGVSLASHHLSSLKVTLGNKFPESLIRTDYTRYYRYYRFRAELRNSFFCAVIEIPYWKVSAYCIS